MSASSHSSAGVDKITVLTTFGPVLAKRWQSDGSITSYDDALQFRVSERPVATLNELANELAKLSDDPRSAVIRGGFVGDAAAAELMAELTAERAASGQHAAVHPCAVYRRGVIFRDRPCHWIMLDVDGAETATDPIGSPEAACREFVRERLPVEFHDASFYWSLSGSAGAPKHAGKLKAHIWFWLARPYTSAQLRAWRVTVPAVDGSLFQPVQLHYTAAPVFHRPEADPVRLRAGLFRGTKDAVDALVVPNGPTAADSAVGDARRRPMKDPGDKPGLVGAFCRVFRPQQLLDLLPDELERGRDDRHFSWLGHDAPDGIYITTCGHGVANGHDSAPTGTGKRFNVFDFVRLHRFGALDEEASSSVPMQKRPSWCAMVAWIREAFPEVMDELSDARTEVKAQGGVSADGEGDPYGGQTKEQVIDELRSLRRDEVATRWVSMTKHLPKSESAVVVDEVAHLVGCKLRRTLWDALKEAQEQDRRGRAEARHRDRIGGRGVIRYQVENRTEVAREIERLIVERIPVEAYFEFSGQLSRLAVSTMPGSRRADDSESDAPPVPRIEPLNDVNVLELVERVAVLELATERGVSAIAVPVHIVKILLDKSLHACARVAGLVTHPLVLPGGRIVSQDGLDTSTALYFNHAELLGARSFRQDEARLALDRLRSTFLLDFTFRSALDEDCAIAALMTGVQRRMLDIAPGVAVLAPGQSSGKTTLARRIHLILTGHDMPVISFPERNEDEVAKQLLATLMCSPATVCFDNLVDGTTFRSGCIAAALTGSVFSKRILGESRVVTCPTNTLFMLTGNNISLGADEVTRWLTIHLRPTTDRPDRREFKQPDVVSHALGIRQSVLSDVVGIVAGYMTSGTSMPTLSRFPMWDRIVRQALIWAGGADVAEVFSANTDAAEETQAYRGLVQLLHEVFGSRIFTVEGVATLAREGSPPDPDRRRRTFADWDVEADATQDDVRERTRAILGALRSRDPGKAESVGRVLKAAVGRPVDVPGAGLLALIGGSRNGYAQYRIGPG